MVLDVEGGLSLCDRESAIEYSGISNSVLYGIPELRSMSEYEKSENASWIGDGIGALIVFSDNKRGSLQEYDSGFNSTESSP